MGCVERTARAGRTARAVRATSWCSCAHLPRRVPDVKLQLPAVDLHLLQTRVDTASWQDKPGSRIGMLLWAPSPWHPTGRRPACGPRGDIRAFDSGTRHQFCTRWARTMRTTARRVRHEPNCCAGLLRRARVSELHKRRAANHKRSALESSADRQTEPASSGKSDRSGSKRPRQTSSANELSVFRGGALCLATKPARGCMICRPAAKSTAKVVGRFHAQHSCLRTNPTVADQQQLGQSWLGGRRHPLRVEENNGPTMHGGARLRDWRKGALRISSGHVHVVSQHQHRAPSPLFGCATQPITRI